MYDYLIVGAGLYGATFARLMIDAGKKCLVIDKRDHVGGNAHTKKLNGINVHEYGAHIFHTNNKDVWDFVQRFAEFNRYTHSPITIYNGTVYSLPFNMYTFNKIWGAVTPLGADEKIQEQRGNYPEPKNLEEQAISLVGEDIYEILVKGYTQKQWGRPCKDLPANIIKRLPVRMTYDNNYFDAKYQGIPIGGYTQMVEKMLAGCDVELGTDYLKDRVNYNKLANKVVYTGAIDAFFDYKLGTLEYRSLRFEHEVLTVDNYQGCSVVNYTDAETPWTRIVEHKWFEFGKDENGEPIEGTIISKEYSAEWSIGKEAYYPINDAKNNKLYEEYRRMADHNGIIIGGRLGEYKYYDMDKVIERAMDKAGAMLGATKQGE